MDTKNQEAVNHAEFWEKRYEAGEIQWDIGYISTPIHDYIDNLIAKGVDKNSHILIPGAGNAYEAEHLHEEGFTNVIVVDFAAEALARLANKYPDFPREHLVQADFFTLSPETYQFDYVIEQTFFCAIDPSRREDYAKHMQALLKPTGELFGVLFDQDFKQSPPFGGHLAEYQALFTRYFTIKTMEPCYNSIPPRQGSELFVRLIPKP